MAENTTTSWKFAAAVLIWLVAAVWIIVSIVINALGGVFAALAFGAIASLLLSGYSSSDVDKL